MSWLVTGTGAAAGVGRDPRELFDSLCAGRSAHAELRGFDRSRYAARYAYEIDDRPVPGADVPGRATAWLLEAVAQAARDAGLGEDLSGVPVLVGTGLRELRSAELWWRDGTPMDAEGLHFGRALRERFGATSVYTFANACSASLYALAMGTDLLELGEADTVIAAGVDVLTESMYGLVERVHPVPPDRVRPFDRDRTGAVMGDGAAAVVIRREAQGRTGGVRGRLRSVGPQLRRPPRDGPRPSRDRRGHPAGARAGRGQAGGHRPGDAARHRDAAERRGGGHRGGRGLRPARRRSPDDRDQVDDRPHLRCLRADRPDHRAARARCRSRPTHPGLSHPVAEAADFRFVTGEAARADLSVAQINAFGFGGINAVAVVEGVR